MSGRRRRRFGKKTDTSSKAFQTFEDILEDNDFSFSHVDIAANNTLKRDSLSSTHSNSFGFNESIEGQALRFSIEASVGTIQQFQDDIISVNTNTGDNVEDTTANERIAYTPTQPSSQKSLETSVLSEKNPPTSDSINCLLNVNVKRKKLVYGSVNKQELNNEGEHGFQDDNDVKMALSSFAESRHNAVVEEQVRGASTDVYAVQDAGSYRLGYEHCLYLCSTISSIKPYKSEDSHKSHTVITANAACELADMISKAKERSELLVSSGETCSSALSAILTALSSAPVHTNYSKYTMKDDYFSKHKYNNYKSNFFNTPPIIDTSTKTFQFSSDIKDAKSRTHNFRTRSSRTKNKKHKNKVKPESSSNTDTPSNEKLLTSRLSNAESAICDNDSRVALALGVVVHFLAEEAVSSIHIRDSILKHGLGLQGICRLIHFDPIIHAHEYAIEEQSIKPEAIPSKIQESMNDGLDDSNDKIENFNMNTIDTCKRKCDPTAYGRRKRKMKRIRQQLTDITQDMNNYPLNISTDNIKIKETSNYSTPNMKHTSISSQTNIAKPHTIHHSLDQSSKKLQGALARVRIEYNILIPNKSELKETPHENMTAGFVTMNAIKKIISQKHSEKDGEVCENTLEDQSKNIDVDNPFYTNKALRESGSLLILADVIKNILASTLHHIDSFYENKFKVMNQEQWKHLYELNLRFNILVSIVDEACCLTPGNRKELVEQTGVIERLAQLLSKILDFEEFLNPHCKTEATQSAIIQQTCLAEMLSSSLRILTSLTHENYHAGLQLLSKVKLTRVYDGKISTSSESGFFIIFDALNKMVKARKDLNLPKSSNNKYLVNNEKCIYDAIIFCLNTLTNIAETPTLLEIVQRDILSSTVISNSDIEESNHKCKNGNEKFYCGSSTTAIEEQAALQWLSGWLVDETESYREMIMGGCYGGKKNDTKNKCTIHEERPLKKNEEESLVIAGNGFVLLACLMKDSQCNSIENPIYHDTKEQKRINGVGPLAFHIRHNVLSQMPKGNKIASGGINFMIKTLKAFLNFYHYSIGDLSVAVVEPVLKLIDQLTKLK